MAENYPPQGYVTPPFPSLHWPVLDETAKREWSLYYLGDIWRFTLIWTVTIYALFHLGAAAVTILMHGKRKSSWKYLWLVPIAYFSVAGIEALVAGSVVGLM
jgi:hypothetical protein